MRSNRVEGARDEQMTTLNSKELTELSFGILTTKTADIAIPHKLLEASAKAYKLNHNRIQDNH